MDANDSYRFLPINSTAPGFNAGVIGAGTVLALESSDRFWSGPANRYIRVSSITTTDLFISFGSTGATDLPSTTTGMLLLMPGTYVLPIAPGNPGIGMKTFGTSSSYYIVLGTIV